MIAPYKYKLPPKTKVDRRLKRSISVADDENLTGLVQNMDASDIEERFARALRKRDIRFTFQPSYFQGRNVPGEIRLDFMVDAGWPLPVMVDGEYAHKSAEAQAEDRIKDALLDDHLRGTGALPVIRITGDLLQTQEDADRVVNERIP